MRETARKLWRLIADHAALRSFLVANALWELALAALKTFVILYLTLGLGYRTSSAALIVGAAAIFVLVGAAAGGKLADRFGRLRAMRFVLPVYGLGLLVPALTTSRPVLIAVTPIVALGGGAVMTLPYALLMPLMPRDAHGALTGFYSLSRGLGAMLGPLLAGVAVSALAGALDATRGYAAAWGVSGAAVLLSLPLLLALERQSQDRGALRRA